ncbi:MAG TPA: excinuclease ABC subunit UvrA [Bacteroidetes bacterium]|nr:excinuclease ABC subunit UvrA [Bacteroidota bacterium]
MPSSTALSNHQIEIRGARVHNLKNISLDLPRDRLIVITGLSGSGKSSLAFDTLYAEGQRRYVESLSAYARQFLGRMQKPEVDHIRGLPPAIAIEQRVNTRNPRSTVGTSTEIYDYLKLLFARIGKTISPVSNREVIRHTVTDVVDFIFTWPEGTRMMILSPCVAAKECSLEQNLEIFLQQGITRFELDGEVCYIEDLLKNPGELKNAQSINIVIDRMVVAPDADTRSRMGDSVQTAFNIGKGRCLVKVYAPDGIRTEEFSNRFEADGMEFEEPSVHMFSFNNPIGACPRCEGYGKIMGIDEDLVIPNKSLSVYEDAIACWKGEKMQKWKQRLIMNASRFGFPIHTPYYRLSESQKRLLWTGNRYFKGLDAFFQHLEEKKYKIQYRVMLSRYRGKTTCPVCEGTRLKKEAGYVKIQGHSMQELVWLPVDRLFQFFNELQLEPHEEKIAGRILTEIRNRLDYLVRVGLSYLTLNRLSSTLSGGESQRINLANALGSSLVGSLYILDEPSIGLHPRDTHRLIEVLKRLQQLGNTVMVVEHDEEIIRSADHLVDIGPLAGRLGGEVIFEGSYRELLRAEKSLTGDYLSGRKSIPLPRSYRKWNSYIGIRGAREHNLKNLNVKFPLHVMTVITGVSGSGKSTLVGDILLPALKKRLQQTGERAGEFDSLEGDIHAIGAVEFVDQNPIGRSSRSNPVTYIKAWDDIRKLFADQPASRYNGFKPSHFSFNVEGGRCEECQGEGIIRVEMQFMADVELVCESCGGKRFKDDVLEVQYRGKNIYDVLQLTIDEAIEFFSGDEGPGRKISARLQPLADVGLGYIKLGQSSSTLSGGESQRVKLASFLGKDPKAEKILFLFDEPTTGLHFHDINKLLQSFHALIEQGHTVIIIEHNLEVIKSADWVIDLGPEGGEEGGRVLFEGTPAGLAGAGHSYTGRFLKQKIGAGEG